MRAAPHLFHDQERAQVVEVGFAAAGRSGGADFVVHVESRAENRRVADAAGNLPRQPAGRRHAADVAAGVDAVAVDRAVIVIGIDEAFTHHLQAGVVPGLRPRLRIRVVLRIDAALPLEPEPPGRVGVEVVLDLESDTPREVLRALADDEVMVGQIHHLLGDVRRRADAFQRGHASRALPGPVHTARVELDDAVGIRQAAVADARVFGIELDDVDAGDERVEDVGVAARHQVERALDGGLRSAVLVAVAVGGRHDDGLHAAGTH